MAAAQQHSSGDLPCASYRNEKSANGFSLKVLKSALQKYARRGMRLKLLQTIKEFHTFSQAKDSEGNLRKEVASIRTNYMHRLLVITLEDVGCVSAAHVVRKILEPAMSLQFGDSEAMKAEAVWARLVCMWTKSRSGSHLKSLATLAEAFEPGSPTGSPTSNLAAHIAVKNGKFKQVKRTLEEWSKYREPTDIDLNNIGVKEKGLVNLMVGWRIASGKFLSPNGKPKYFPNRKKPYWHVVSKSIEWAVKNTGDARWEVMGWYAAHVPERESCLCWILPLGAALGFAAKHPAQLSGTNVSPRDALQMVIDRPLYVDEKKDLYSDKLTIDHFVLDLHTGHSSADSKHTFATVGAVVCPEAPPACAELRNFYAWRKRTEDWASKSGSAPVHESLDKLYESTVPRENELFDFVLRAQLTTGDAKTDTYFAYDVQHSELVVVKGPLGPDVDANRVVELQKLKSEIGGLSTNNTRVVRATVDSNIYVPLGVRKSSLSDWDEPQLFIVATSIIDERDLRCQYKSSKKWPETMVLDWRPTSMKKHLVNPLNWILSDNSLIRQFVELLTFRYLVGVVDHASRNFLVDSSGVMYSLDEDTLPCSTVCSLAPELQKRKTKLIVNWLEANPGVMESFVEKFTRSDSTLVQKDRLSQLSANFRSLFS